MCGVFGRSGPWPTLMLTGSVVSADAIQAELYAASARAACSPSARPLLSIARITVSLSPSRCSVTICSGSIAKTVRSRSMSARMTVSVTPDFASATTWSTVIAEAARGARRRTLIQPRITALRIIAPMLRLFATNRPVEGARNPKETKGYAIRTVDSDQDTFHAEGTVSLPPPIW